MIFTDEQQDKIAEKYTSDMETDAWQTLCQIELIRTRDIPIIEKDIHAAKQRVEAIDKEMAEIKAADFDFKKNSERIRSLNIEKEALESRLNGNPKVKIPGLFEQAGQLYQQISMKQAEAERKFDLAKHARTWRLKEVETAETTEEIKS